MAVAIMDSKPYDSRLAHACVAPFRNTRLHPNHITALSLALGVLAGVAYAGGGTTPMNVGAALYMLSMFVDHMDGEFARMTGKTSEAGHKFDRQADLAVKLAAWSGMGIGLARNADSVLPVLQGVACGVAFVAIFAFHSMIGRRTGEGEPDQPSTGTFEIEDVLYLVGPITWFGILPAFLIVASVGAPFYAFLVFLQLQRTPGGQDRDER